MYRERNPVTERSRWRPLPFIALGVAMIIIDATIVNVAIPSMIRTIGLTTTTAEWVNATYSLVFASLLLTVGRLGDAFGRRRMFLLGTAIFVAASLVAALAPGPGVLIFGRVLQGIGGALLLPSSLSTVNATYHGRDRGIAFAIWGSTIGGAAALGPLLGGWLTTEFSWRWAFLINLPIGLIVAFGVWRFAPETSDPTATKRIDFVGALLSTLGFGALVFGLIEGQRYGWWHAKPAFANDSLVRTFGGSSPSVVAFAVSAVALFAFVAVQRLRAQQGKHILLDLKLFEIRSFRYGNIAAMIVSLGEFGLLFALPLFLQSALGYSALRTGAVLAVLAVGTFLSSPFSAKLTASHGARMVVRLGLLLEVIAIGFLGAVLSTHLSLWSLLAGLLVYGAGVGFATAQLTGVVLADVPIEASGQASAVQSTTRQVGAALGTAILGAVLVVSLGRGVSRELGHIGVPADQAGHLADLVTTAPAQALPTLAGFPDSAAVRAAVDAAFVSSTRAVAWAAAAWVLLGLLATLLLPRVDVTKQARDEPTVPKADIVGES